MGTQNEATKAQNGNTLRSLRLQEAEAAEGLSLFRRHVKAQVGIVGL